MCSGASTAAPPNYTRVVQFSLSVVSKASFQIFLTTEDDTNYTATLRSIPDEQTPGFISLMIRAGGRRPVVKTAMNPIGVHVMRGILHWLRNYEASPGGLYCVAWLTSRHVMSCPTHGCCACRRQPVRAVGGHWEGPAVVPGCSSIQPIGPTLLASTYRSRLLLRT